MAVLFYFCTTEDDPEMSKHIPKAVYRSRITFFIALLGLSSWWGYPAGGFRQCPTPTHGHAS